MKKFIFYSRSGYTLVEVIIVLFIVGIIFVPVLNYFTGSIGQLQDIEKRSQANSIISDVIELIRSSSASDWSSIDTWETASEISLTNYKSTELNSFLDDYKLLSNNYKINVELDSFDFPSVTDDDKIGRKLSVSISWESGKEAVSTLIRSGDEL